MADGQETGWPDLRVAGRCCISPKYHIEQGEYPRTLESLIPQYIDVINEPSIKNSKWVYTVNDSNFVLKVDYVTGITSGPVLIFESHERRWITGR